MNRALGTNTGLEEHSICIDGRAVHYQAAGEGFPLLMLHGLIGSSQTWRQNIAALARSARVYAIDFLNMGKSHRIPGLDPGLAATADRLAALMDGLGLETVDIAGHSHGGAIALMMAARHPARVRKLLLFAPANPFCNAGNGHLRFFQSPLGRALGRFAPSFPRVVQAKALSRMYGDPSRVLAGTLERYTEDLRIPGTMEHVLAIIRRWFDDMGALRAALDRVSGKPILLIWGDRDRAVSLLSAYCLREHLPGSTLLILPGAGHLPFEEIPDTCNRLMQEWLDEAFPVTRDGEILNEQPSARYSPSKAPRQRAATAAAGRS